MADLKQLQTLVDGLTASNSQLAKKQAFQAHAAAIKPLVSIIHDPFRMFHLTSKSVLAYEKKHAACHSNLVSLQELLEGLASKQWTGHAALQQAVDFLAAHPTYRSVILGALNKNLKVRFGPKLMNKVFPLLVPQFSIALSQSHDKHLKFYKKHEGKWFCSRKLDGVRCLFVCDPSSAEPVKAYSRSGKVYPPWVHGLRKFYDHFAGFEGVLDGEMVVVDGDEKEHFNKANSIMNPNATKASAVKARRLLNDGEFLCFYAFDWIPLATFRQTSGGPIWSARQKHLLNNVRWTPFVRMLQQYPASNMDSLWTKARANGWEGLILRLDADYQGKKSNQMLKRKYQADDEFEIKEATASLQMVPGSSGKQTALEHVRIEYKGCAVWVGSGLDWGQKVDFGRDPSVLVGRQITVKHNGETRDRNGNFSLRHPTIKHLWPVEGRTT